MDDHDQHPSQDVHAKSSTMAQTNAAADLARAGSTARSNAIAKLRRAASQRELRKGPVTALAGASSEFRSGSAAGNYSHIGDGVDIRSGVETPTDEPLPHDTASIPQSTDDSHSEQAMSREPSRSPLAPPLSSLDAQIGIRSPYSRLARSPLPSLEELRARIKEREAHGLSRSASASAASQAARAFAMNKLLGGSNRGTGAQSPSSDFLGNRTPSPLPDSVAGAAWERDGRSLKERAALRRSRTVGGLSAMAEAQRRAAFGGNGESSAQGAEGQYGDGPSELPPRANTAMSHTDSKRQAARTEMMRKLSGRGRGAKSPRNLPPGESAVSAEKPFTSPLTLGLVPPTPGNADVIRTATSPALSVRTFASSRRLRRRSSASSIPASTISAYSYAPSTHTGRHTMERDRDSALAKLVGEDSFQYEQLLSMGYSSEAAYSTVMSSPSVQSFRSRRNEPPDFEGPMPDREEGAATPDLGQVHTQWQAVDGIGLEVGTQTPETDEGFDSFKAWTEAQRRASIQARLEQRELQLEGEQEQREQDVRNQSDSITPNGYDQHYPLESPDGEQENGLEAIPIAMNPIPAANASTVSFPLTVSAHTSQLAAQSSTSLATSTTSSVEGQSDAHSIQTAQGAAPRLSFQTQGSSLGSIRQVSPPSSKYIPATEPEFETVTKPVDSTGLELSRRPSERLNALLGASFVQEYGSELDLDRPLEPPSRSFLSPGEPESDDSLTDWEEFKADDDEGATVDDRYLRRVDKVAEKLGRLAKGKLSSTDSLRKVNAAADGRSPTSSPRFGDDPRGSPRMDASQTNSPASTTISGMASRLGQSSSTVMNRPKDNHRAGPTRHVKSPSASSVLPSRPWEQRSSPMSPLAEQPTQTPAPTLSAQDLQSAQVQKGIEYHVPAASSAELASFYANDKLTPFPGLFRPGSETESLLATKPEFQVSAEKQSPRVTQPNKAWSRPLSPESTSSRTVAKSPSFLFSILKKKAPGSGPQVPSPTRRFFDTKHTRSPSRAEEERSEADLPIQIISKEAGNRLADFADLSRTSSLTSSASTTQHGSVENPSSSLSPATTAMIQRYSHLLTSQSAPVPGVSPAAIEDPPRKLLMAAPIFQIVNSSTIKDRFFFVFNDILVIAKPVVAEQEGKDAAAPSLRSNFAVKNIIELHQIKLSDPEEHSPSDPRAPSLMATFVEGFQSDPKGALDKLIRVSGLPNNSSTAAQLLYQTPELDRDRLTKYLCAPERHMTLRAYVGRYRFAGMPLESALRVFLMELRFPTDLSCFEALLQHFASRWTEVNASLIDSRFTPELVMQLVFAIMVLNDSLHSRSNAPAAGCAFSLPNPHISRQEFVAAFRSRDPDLILTDKSLCRIYAGIKAEPLCQALAAHEGPRIEVRLSTQMPSKLAYGLPSEPITISIPAPDPDFAIRLYGQDLEFDPPLLTFERTSLCSFTMVSKNVGPKCVIFARAGRNSRYYSGLPLSRPVNIERAFMRHNFVLTFKNSHGSKRKYMFSVEDSETRRRWIDMLKEQIATSIAVRKQLSSATGGLLSPQARRAAEAVALQVLRDALVISDESLAASLSQDHHYYQKPAPVMLTSNAKPVNRSVSVSRHYYASSGAGRLERELMLNGHGHGDGDVVRTPEANGAGVTGVAKDGSSSPPAPLSAGTVRTGEEVVTTCQQNSLLPLVLSFLQAGLGGEKDKSF